MPDRPVLVNARLVDEAIKQCEAAGPNETGGAILGKIVRQLWDKIRALQALPRSRPLIQLLVLDEIDSLGSRAGANEPVYSAAQSDALEASPKKRGVWRNFRPGPERNINCRPAMPIFRIQASVLAATFRFRSVRRSGRTCLSIPAGPRFSVSWPV